MDRKFYLYKRKNGIFYAELIIDGERIIRSTREIKRDKAAVIAAQWLAEGIPAAQGEKTSLAVIADYKALMNFIHTGSITESQAVDINRALLRRGLITTLAVRRSNTKKKLIDFLLEYWDYDNSPALKEKRAHGKQVLKDTCYSAKNIIQGKWKPYFNDKTLSEITQSDIKNFGLSLSDKGLSSSTINNAILYGTMPLKWAYHEKIISENICEGLTRFKGVSKKRDILTDEEIELLKDYKYWRSLRGYVAFRLASTSAMRNSEIRSLDINDIDVKIICIKRSHNRIDGFKKPKNNEERTVYIIPEVNALIKKLLAENPYDESSGIESYFQKQYIFYSDTDFSSPCDISLFPEALKTAMKNAEIEPAGRKIDFHSLRHYCAKKWADGTGDLRKAAKVTGHKTLRETEKYADHTTEAEIIRLGDQAAKIFSFKKRA